MEGLKQIVLNICFVSLIAGLFRLLVPADGLGKTAGFILSISLLLFFTAPMTEGYDRSRLFDVEIQDFTPAVEDAQIQWLKDAAEAETRTVVQTAAKTIGVPVQVLSVEVDYRDNKVWIDSVSVCVTGTEIQGMAVQKEIQKAIDTTVNLSLEEP